MKRMLVLFIVGVVLFGIFSAQSANAQSANIEKRIIGTWVRHSGDTWVFDSNGNLTLTSSDGRATIEMKFAVTDTQLVFSTDYGTDYAGLEIYNISMSSDGRTLILTGIYNTTSGSVSSNWLTKR